jgi:hypothetical protein
MKDLVPVSGNMKNISLHQTNLSLHQLHTLMISKNKGSLPAKHETPTDPMT